MQLVKLGAVLVALAIAGAGYLQEWHRLTVVQRLPGPQARAYYEARRRASDRVMLGIAIAFSCLAVAVVTYVALSPPAAP